MEVELLGLEPENIARRASSKNPRRQAPCAASRRRSESPSRLSPAPSHPKDRRPACSRATVWFAFKIRIARSARSFPDPSGNEVSSLPTSRGPRTRTPRSPLARSAQPTTPNAGTGRAGLRASRLHPTVWSTNRSTNVLPSVDRPRVSSRCNPVNDEERRTLVNCPYLQLPLDDPIFAKMAAQLLVPRRACRTARRA